MAVGLDLASPEFPEEDVASVVVSLDPDVAELCDDDTAEASPELEAAPAAAALPETAPIDPATTGSAADVPVTDAAPVPLSAADVPDPPGPDVAVLVESLLELAGPVSPPWPVALDVDDPEEPELADPDDDELAGPELPAVELPVTAPESPVVTSTAIPPVPPPDPPPVPPLLAPAPPLSPDDPLALAPPPLPVSAVAPPPDVASPVSPLDEVDVVSVVDDPEVAPDPDDEVDDEVPLPSGASSVLITLAELCGVSCGSIEAMRAAKAIFSNMARSVLSAVTSGDGYGGQGLLAPVLRKVGGDVRSTLATTGHEHGEQGQESEQRDRGVDEQDHEADPGLRLALPR